MSKSDDITYNIFGFNNIQPIWGDEFIKEISKCRFGLNLSRGHPVKYYSSNRIATLVANGMPTLIDEKIKYREIDASIILKPKQFSHHKKAINCSVYGFIFLENLLVSC